MTVPYPHLNTHDEVIMDQFTKQAIPFAAIPGHSAEEATRLLVETARLQKEDTLLDVACGPGLLVCSLAPYVRHATGVDLVPAMLELARKTAGEKGLTNVSWDAANVSALPYAPESFAVVVSRYTFHHFENPKAVLQEMVRVAAPKGRVAVIDVFARTPEQAAAYDTLEKLRDPSHVHTLTLQELQSTAEAAGLRNLSLRFYKVEIALETQLKASFPKDPGDLEKIRRAAIADVGKDELGWGLHRKGAELFTALPIAVITGEKD